MFKESATRSFVKALVWRTIATLTTTLLVLIFTRRIDIAVTVGGIEAVAKILLYFGHERVWDKLKFGREPVSAVNVPPHSLSSETITLANGGAGRRSASIASHLSEMGTFS